MNVDEAVMRAKAFVADLYRRTGEGAEDVRLEEVDRAGERWLVTISFRRTSPDPTGEGLAAQLRQLQRSFRQVIVESDGAIDTMKSAPSVA